MPIFELVLMKIIWKNGGVALYSLVIDELSTLLRQDILSEDEMKEVERYWEEINESIESDTASSSASEQVSPDDQSAGD